MNSCSRFLCGNFISCLNGGIIEVQKGNFTSWYKNKQMQDQYERSENNRLKKDIRRLEAAARQSGEWADQVESAKIGKKSMGREKSIDTRAYIGEKSRRMQMRRKSLELRQGRAIEDKKGLLKNIEEAEDLKLYSLKYRSSRILSLKDVVPYYEGPVCDPLSFTLEQGQRISLQGKNGCGKSSILKLIARSLCEQAHLYIWDEPLNFIDVYSRIQIEDLILKFQPTMLLVEHDDAFTGKVATGVVKLMDR